MKVRNRRHVLLASTMIITAAIAALFFEPLTRVVRIENPGETLVREAQQEFEQLFAAPGAQGWHEGISRQGFNIMDAAAPLDAMRLDESAEDCAGRGAYMVSKRSDAAPLLISAPHRAADRHTGTLGLQLFAEGDLAAAAWNSAPRRASDACAHAADLARSPLNHFTAFSLAFAITYPAGRVVQLHGFDREVRQSQAGSDADIILSNGTDEAGDDLLDIADCLSAAFAHHRVMVYPNDVSELGALTNAQGRALRENGFASFVHVEMSLGIREALIGESDARSKFVGCLVLGAGS